MRSKKFTALTVQAIRESENNIRINDLINSHPPLNIAGYQIPKYFCTECAYAETILGSHSNYNYNPKQNFMLDNEMVGDTINIFIETTFNFETSQREVILDHLKIIVL